MNTDFRASIEPMIGPAARCAAELGRLGDEIAELSAHLDAATARLLDLIRDFDARGGWIREGARADPCRGSGHRRATPRRRQGRHRRARRAHHPRLAAGR